MACKQELKKLMSSKITNKNFTKLVDLLSECGTDEDWEILKNINLKEDLKEALNQFSVVDMIVNKGLYKDTKVLYNILSESKLPDFKQAKEIQKQIDKLVKAAPKGGFMDPADEKAYWKIINDLYHKLDKIINH
jgi:hypothetical protein